MTKDNIALAALLQTREACWETGVPPDPSQVQFLPPSPLSLVVFSTSLRTQRCQGYTQSYFRRLPTLCRKLRFSLFFSFKDPINLESQNQAKNIPVGLPSSNQNLSKIGQDVLKLLKNNLTNKHRLQLYIYFSPIPFRISIQFSPSKV